MSLGRFGSCARMLTSFGRYMRSGWSGDARMARVWVRDPVPHAEGLQERGGDMSTYFEYQAAAARRRQKTNLITARVYVAIAVVMAVLSIVAFANGSWVGWVDAGLVLVWLVLARFIWRTAKLNQETAEGFDRLAARK